MNNFDILVHNQHVTMMFVLIWLQFYIPTNTNRAPMLILTDVRYVYKISVAEAAVSVLSVVEQWHCNSRSTPTDSVQLAASQEHR